MLGGPRAFSWSISLVDNLIEKSNFWDKEFGSGGRNPRFKELWKNLGDFVCCEK